MRWCIASCAALSASASVVKCAGGATFVASVGGRPLGFMGTCLHTGGKMISGLDGKAVVGGVGTCGGAVLLSLCAIRLSLSGLLNIDRTCLSVEYGEREDCK